MKRIGSGKKLNSLNDGSNRKVRRVKTESAMVINVQVIVIIRHEVTCGLENIS